MRARIALSATLVFVGAALSFASAAGAVVTLGRTAPKPEEAFCGGFSPYDYVTQSVGAGPSYAVPAGGGVITSWSTLGGINVFKNKQVLGFDVLRRAGYATYTKIAEDGPRPITPQTMNTFNLEIPVKGGDLIGLEVPVFFNEESAFCTFASHDPEDQNSYAEPSFPVGKTEAFTLENETGYPLNLSATLVRPPTITALKPASGSIAGSKVTIAGAEFDKVSGVSFGGAPATGIKVTGEGQIVVKAPKAKKPGEVPVLVTTFAGTTALPATYTYTACRVPKLGGKTLTAAKRGLKAAGCRLGKVSTRGGATSGSGVVVGQSPKPGKLTGTGSKVAVTLAP